MLQAMTNVLNRAFFLCGLITFCSSNVQITSSPQTISNATLGSTVRFECQTSTSAALPEWNINGRDYRVTELPLGYDFESILNSKVLIVSSVEIEMNNSVYYCYLTYSTSGGRVRVESERATLIIQALHYVSSLKATTLQVMGSAKTSMHSISPPITSSPMASAFSYTKPNPAVSVQTKGYYTPTSVPKLMQNTLHIMVGCALLATAILAFLLATAFALIIWICRHRKRKDHECTGQVYDEISGVTTVNPNPSYETCQLKVNVERNPAYELINKKSHSSNNPRDHVYDVVAELKTHQKVDSDCIGN